METSFLVVETEAQKQALYRKQKETMRARTYLDSVQDDPNDMDEPALFWLLLFVLVLYLLHRRYGLPMRRRAL